MQIGSRVRIDLKKSDSNLNEHKPSARGKIQSPKIHTPLKGGPAETEILISRNSTTALIVTGSNISTLSKTFYVD
jgi:hypothetical protein